MEALARATTIPIAITSHDEKWAREFLNLGLRQHYTHILDQFPKYVISPYLQSETSIRRFLPDQQIPELAIDYLLGMKDDVLVKQTLKKTH